jgi:hypothetical protein
MFTSSLQQAIGNRKINNHHTCRMSSGSADEVEGGMVKVNDWQIVKNNKR